MSDNQISDLEKVSGGAGGYDFDTAVNTIIEIENQIQASPSKQPTQEQKQRLQLCANVFYRSLFANGTESVLDANMDKALRILSKYGLRLQ